MTRLVALVIRLAYFLRLRRPINDVQRWLAERNAPRSPLPRFETPDQAVAYALARKRWGKDKLGRWLPIGDWSSLPEVTQGRMEAHDGRTGDCDDYHAWVAEQLLRTPDVVDVLRMSCWTWTRGHTTCVFQRSDGRLFLVDYEIYEVESYRDALAHVQRRYKYSRLRGWVFETPDLELVAVWPEVP